VRRVKRSSIVVEIVDDEVVGVTSILIVWSVETSIYLFIAAKSLAESLEAC
jgi:hypothetical protein